MTDYMTADEVARYLDVARERAPKIMSEHNIRAVRVYPAAEVRTVERPGRGARTDRLRTELRDLARRVVADAPLPRQVRVDKHVLPDGVVVLVSWHRTETLAGPQPNAVDVEALDSVRAIAPTRVMDDTGLPSQVWSTGDLRWVYGVDLRDEDDTLAALVRVVAAARRDHSNDQAMEQTRQATRDAALTDLAAAAQRVATARGHDFLAACDDRRHVVRSYRDSPQPVLSEAEIADAADLTVDDVQRA